MLLVFTSNRVRQTHLSIHCRSNEFGRHNTHTPSISSSKFDSLAHTSTTSFWVYKPFYKSPSRSILIAPNNDQENRIRFATYLVRGEDPLTVVYLVKAVPFEIRTRISDLEVYSSRTLLVILSKWVWHPMEVFGVFVCKSELAFRCDKHKEIPSAQSARLEHNYECGGNDS